MVEVTIIYWRDIPGQVIAGSGRRAVRAPLPGDPAAAAAAVAAGIEAGYDAARLARLVDNHGRE